MGNDIEIEKEVRKTVRERWKDMEEKILTRGELEGMSDGAALNIF